MDTNQKALVVIALAIIGLGVALYLWSRQAKAPDYNFRVTQIGGGDLPSPVKVGDLLYVNFTKKCHIGSMLTASAFGIRVDVTNGILYRFLQGSYDIGDGVPKVGHVIDDPTESPRCCYEITTWPGEADPPPDDGEICAIDYADPTSQHYSVVQSLQFIRYYDWIYRDVQIGNMVPAWDVAALLQLKITGHIKNQQYTCMKAQLEALEPPPDETGEFTINVLIQDGVVYWPSPVPGVTIDFYQDGTTPGPYVKTAISGADGWANGIILPCGDYWVKLYKTGYYTTWARFSGYPQGTTTNCEWTICIIGG
jgi:hypothetical protein